MTGYKKKGYLVNDTLTCIPGTRTFWHNLLDWIPGLIDKTNIYTDYNILAHKIEQDIMYHGRPDYIIRNATYFRPLRGNIPTISLLQDIVPPGLRELQKEVCNKSKVTVFNTNYTSSLYPEITSRREIIPLGIDADVFKPSIINYREILDILPYSILYVGSSNINPKRFDIVLDLIKNTKFNFCLVMKDNFDIKLPNVKVFNKVNHELLMKIYNSCSMMICPSIQETQHLAGIEGGLCNLPILANNVGIYFNRPDGLWGRRIRNNWLEEIKEMFTLSHTFNPRKYWLEEGLDLNSCKNKWIKIVEGI